MQSIIATSIAAALSKQTAQQTKQLAEFQIAIEDKITQLSTAVKDEKMTVTLSLMLDLTVQTLLKLHFSNSSSNLSTKMLML